MLLLSSDVDNKLLPLSTYEDLIPEVVPCID
jgi:hypothetical protein